MSKYDEGSVVPLYDHRRGNNPPKLIGYWNRAKGHVYTPNGSYSDEEVYHTKWWGSKANRAHYRRLQEVQRLYAILGPWQPPLSVVNDDPKP